MCRADLAAVKVEEHVRIGEAEDREREYESMLACKLSLHPQKIAKEKEGKMAARRMGASNKTVNSDTGGRTKRPRPTLSTL